jgi:hypothetical protein
MRNHRLSSDVVIAIAATLLSLVVVPRRVGGQLVADTLLVPGTQVRLQLHDGSRREVTFERQSSEWLLVRDPCPRCDSLIAIPWRSVGEIGVRADRPPTLARVLGGAVLGAAISYAALATAVRLAGPCDWDRGGCPALAAVIAGPYVVSAGAVTGIVVAVRHRPRPWIAVWRNDAAPGRDR